ncbi:MAG: DUF169 domain-containing protein [Lachnospiraceae bacterium]|nr:DUF169 domain-containing protein [Lachnospiraceae bacterium]
MNRTNEAAGKLKNALHLTLNIQAVKLIEDDSDIPGSALRAREAYGHLSLCQAFALVKRQGLTLYTDRSSEWCWAPVVALGYADCSPGTEAYEIIKPLMGIPDPDKAERFFSDFPRLPLGKYKGVLLAPAEHAEFEADVLLINCDDNFQMRSLLSAVKFRNGKMLDVRLDPIDSCVHTLITSFLKKDYAVAIPDPGEQERALTGKNEIIMAVPAEKLDDLMAGLSFPGFRHNPDPDLPAEMEFDFPRPPFYNKVFALWGMEEGKEWSFPKPPDTESADKGDRP